MIQCDSHTTSTSSEMANMWEVNSPTSSQPNTEVQTQQSLHQCETTCNENNPPSEILVQISDSQEGDFENVIADCINKCKTEKITDPVEVLRCAQKHIVQGRPLDIVSATETIEGETNFIHVNRQEILQSAFDEISFLENLRLTLEVSFYGELASDLGGPRKEFFMLCLREIQSKYFDKGLRDSMSADYETVGVIMGLSMLQNGRVPHFLEEHILQETFISENPSVCIANLRAGFAKVGLFKIGKEIPVFLELFRQAKSFQLTRKKLVNLLKPSFSEEGSNKRRYENSAYKAFSKYVRNVAGGSRDRVVLGNILQFCTAIDQEPPLGFGLPPSIQFVTAVSSCKWAFIPTSNTCSQTLTLPAPSFDISLPAEDELFEVYDHAFCNPHFGLA